MTHFLKQINTTTMEILTPIYEVYVGNEGSVYRGKSEETARQLFNNYQDKEVCLVVDGRIITEFIPERVEI